MKTNSKLLIVIVCLILLSLIGSAGEIAVIEVSEGDLVNLKVSAKDPDQDTLTYKYSPPLNSSGQWQTAYGDYGEWEVNITVSDGKLETVKPVLIKVHKSNRPPVLEEMEDIVVNEGDAVKIEPKATDEEGDKISYTISDPIGNDKVWQTTYEDAGDYLINITASDGLHKVSQEVLIVVEDVNRDPEILDYSPEEENVEIDEDEEKTFSISAKDLDGNSLNYKWELDGVEVSTTDSYVYHPDYESAGDHSLKATVSDSSVIMGVLWDIKVINTNRAPLLENIDDVIVNEGDLVKVNFTATDPDGDDIRYTISDPIGDDKEWQTGYEDAGTYEIKLTVSDGKDEISQKFNVVVKDVDRAPEFEKIGDKEITETETVEFELKATDPDGDKLTFSAENLPQGAALDKNMFSFKTTYDTVIKPKTWINAITKFLHLDNLVYGKQKKFIVKLTSAGKEKSASQEVKITVKSKNRAPELLDMEDMSVNEGEKVKIVPQAVEYDNDRVKFTISDPVGNKGKWQTNFDSAGKYPILITASDGEFADSKNITVNVKNVNRAPVIEAIKPVEVNENSAVSIKPVASDPDGDSIELSVESMPKGAKLVNNELIWTPDYDAVQYRDGIGSYKIVFKATDNGNLTTTQEAVVNVKDVNRAPEFVNVTPKKPIKVYVGDTVIFTGIAKDADNDTLSYTWKFGLFDKKKDATPVLKRKFSAAGDKKITLIASDGIEEISKTFEIRVVEKPVKKVVKTAVKTNTTKTYKTTVV